MKSIDERWEQGIPHDKRSEALYEAIARIDMEHNEDSFDWKSGGDGDNGEELMYILDIYFEELDNKEDGPEPFANETSPYIYAEYLATQGHKEGWTLKELIEELTDHWNGNHDSGE